MSNLPGYERAQAQYDAMTPPEYETDAEFEDEVERLLSPDGDCYPFTAAHVQESLELAIPELIAELMRMAASAPAEQRNEQYAQIGVSLTQHVASYWAAQAEDAAETRLEIKHLPYED